MATQYTPGILWRVLFLAEHYGRMTLTLDEVAEQIGLAPGTIKNRRSRGEFLWLRSEGRTLTADAQDVAAFLERHRSAAAEARDAAQRTAPAAGPIRQAPQADAMKASRPSA